MANPSDLFVRDVNRLACSMLMLTRIAAMAGVARSVR
jgi:hypothetical protein